MTVRDLLSLLREDGWEVTRIRGSHRQLRHNDKSGTVTVAGNLGLDMPIGTLKAILKQAGIEGRR